MHFNAYTGTGGLLAAALANAADRPHPPAPGAVQALLEAHRVARAAVDEEQVAALLAWGDRLRPLFSAGEDLVAHVNVLLGEAAARPFLSTHDGQAPHLHYADEQADVVTRVSATTIASLAAIVAEATVDRLGACAAPGCRQVFVDVSRGGRRTYCTRTCATRMNVDAHRRRNRTVALRAGTPEAPTAHGGPADEPHRPY